MAKKKSINSKFSHPIAELYGIWALDFLTDLVYGISHDIIARPQNYVSVPDNIADILDNFRFRTGSDPEWPNAFQRTLSYKILYRISIASPSLRQLALLCHEIILPGTTHIRKFFKKRFWHFEARYQLWKDGL